MTDSTPSNSFPRWVLDMVPGTEPIFTYLVEFRERYLKEVDGGYTYMHVMQTQMNLINDELIAKGILDLKGGGFSKDVVLPRTHILAALYQNGAGFRALVLLKNVKKVTLIHLLDGLMFGLHGGNLLVSLISLRGMIEHIAHYDDIIDKVSSYPRSTTFEAVNPLLPEISSEILKRMYGTRVDWDQLLEGNANDLLNKNKIKYKPAENRVDRKADTILDAIDNLNKKVKGVRGAYEVLCEFAHPNVGAVMAITQSASPVEDKQGFLWIRKQIGLAPPLAAAEATGLPLFEILKRVVECLQHFEKILQETDRQCEKVQQMSQVILKRVIKANPGLVDQYADCPCASGLKTRFCCGATTH